MEKPRYKILRGKWGLYFYDTELNEDLDMEVALRLLNRGETLRETVEISINDLQEARR